MSNDESLNLVESALADTEAELTKLDELSLSAQASEETIKTLEDSIFELHRNHAGLEQKTRAQRLTNATALLDLERGDLSTLKSKIDNQSNRVVAFGLRAKSLLQQVHAEVLAARKERVLTLLHEHFDFDPNYQPLIGLMARAFCVIEVAEIKDSLFQYRWLPTERALAVSDARAMRERSAGLLMMAANEPGLELAIVNVELGPIATAKPAPSANVLGTLAQAVAA